MDSRESMPPAKKVAATRKRGARRRSRRTCGALIRRPVAIHMLHAFPPVARLARE